MLLRARQDADAANESLGAALRAHDLDGARAAHAQLVRAHAHELELVRAKARAGEHALHELLACRAAFETSTHEQLARLFGEGDNATTGTAPSAPRVRR